MFSSFSFVSRQHCSLVNYVTGIMVKAGFCFLFWWGEGEGEGEVVVNVEDVCLMHDSLDNIQSYEVMRRLK